MPVSRTFPRPLRGSYFIATLLVAFLSSTLTTGIVESHGAHAISNPLIRNCVINGGVFQVEPFGADDMALCRWGQVIVDSQTLLSNLNGLTSEAASVILSDVVTSSCTAILADPFSLKDGQVLCVFSDESKLSIEAMKAGLSDPNRLRLKEVLLSR